MPRVKRLKHTATSKTRKLPYAGYGGSQGKGASKKKRRK